VVMLRSICMHRGESRPEGINKKFQTDREKWFSDAGILIKCHLKNLEHWDTNQDLWKTKMKLGEGPYS